MDITEVKGYWTPATAPKAWRRYSRRSHDMEISLRHTPGRRIAVQAGGNIGAWPLYLSSRFEEVYTFEPEAVNFKCLVRNIAKTTNINARLAALGDVEGMCGLNVSTAVGSHSVIPGDKIPMMTIDGLRLEGLDFLMLDIEGYEFEALKGGLETIRKYWPTITLEERGLGVKKGSGHTFKDILRLLPEYHKVDEIHYDVVLRPR